MIGKYIKNANGRGVVLSDSNILSQIREKEALRETIKGLQSQIDTLNERLLRLEAHKKD
jgi:predicted nuclease with TOPRIM domain